MVWKRKLNKQRFLSMNLKNYALDSNIQVLLFIDGRRKSSVNRNKEAERMADNLTQERNDGHWITSQCRPSSRALGHNHQGRPFPSSAGHGSMFTWSLSELVESD